ncbi:MAG: ACT domain-containing protein [Pseudomonadota bacterium]|nr:ACT domain-containing protein [Pseudomonadota bacterium]
MRGTSPKVWNSWKAQLFEETYELTKRALRQGLETPVEQDQLINEKKNQALELLASYQIDAQVAKEYWDKLGKNYLFSCKPEEIAWHTSLILKGPTSEINHSLAIKDIEGQIGTKVLVHADQEQFAFAITTSLFDEFGLSITDARIIPLNTGHSLSIHTVLEQNGKAIDESFRKEKLLRKLKSSFGIKDSESIKITRKIPRQARMFRTPIQVEFATDNLNQRTIMDLITGDRPGLLAEISNVLRDNGIWIRMAKIVTVGERAEDVFYITTENSKPLSETQQDELRKKLINVIDNQDM